MRFKKIIRIYSTLKFIKIVQLYRRLIIKFNKIGLKFFYKKLQSNSPELYKLNSYNISDNKFDNNLFIFDIKFDTFNINWNDETKNKLWNYHLHYFDYLEHFNKDTGIALIHNWINSNPPGEVISWEPYPISLRIVNWIKFISQYSVKEKKIFDSLFIQGIWLFKQREYRLLTNHLFKNIVALLYLGFLFDKKKWKDWSLKELVKQIQEQFTDEGYHYEFSPTYHALFIKDLLDIYNIIKSNSEEFYSRLLIEISDKIKKGLYWLNYFSDYEKYLPINDVNYEGCPKPSSLIKYASNLGIKEKITTDQTISNYYPKLENEDLKIMMYCAPISPSYNPAHSHADILSILLWDNNNPILIETGNYDYEESKERKYARSTIAHNTIVIDNENQCDLWKVFRIGRRGKPFNKKITEGSIQCSHNFYNDKNIIHQRKIDKKDNGFLIKDYLFGNGFHKYEMYFHFAPELVIKKKNDSVIINDEIAFNFSCDRIEIIDTPYFPKIYVRKKKQTIKIRGEFENNKTIITTITKIK